MRPSFSVIFSIRISASLPLMPEANPAASLSESSISLLARAFRTDISICGMAAAFVPSLTEYGKTCIFANPSLSAKSIVSENSSSVSSGKPVIMSVVSDISGNSARSAFTLSSYSAVLYFLFIRFNTVSDPDWSDRWKCGQRCFNDLRPLINSGVMDFGSKEPSLSLSIPGTASIFLSRSRSAVISFP